MRTTLKVCVLAWGLAAQLSAAAQSGAAPASAPQADPAQVQRGQRLFIRCAACHEAGEPKVAKVGPHLKGVVGRKAGTLSGYSYSKGLATAGFEWDDAKLMAWMQRPNDVVPDTTMVFEGLPSEADRRALLAYLRTLR